MREFRVGSHHHLREGQTGPEMRGYIRLNWTRVAFLEPCVRAEPPRTNPDIMLASGNVSIEKRHRESDRARRGAGIKSRGRVFAHVLHRRPDLFADSKLCRTMHPGREPLPPADYKTGKGGISMDALLSVPGASSRLRDHRRFNRPLIRDALLFVKKEKNYRT